MFRFVLLFVVCGIQLLLFVRARRWLRSRSPEGSWVRALLAATFLLFNVAMAAVILIRPRVSGFPSWMLAVAVHPFYIWHGATLILGIIVLAGLLIVLPLKGIHSLLRIIPGIGPHVRAAGSHPAVARFDKSRRTFLRRGMYGLTGASFGGAAYGVLSERSEIDTTRIQFPIDGLPHGLDGFTIGLVSDVHSSAFMTKEDMDVYVSALNALRADMIVVPGDFVNSMTEEVYPFAEAFSALRAPHGVFGVMGNHDFFVSDPERVAREVDACGISLLRNDRILVQKNGAQMYLLGVDDAGRPDRAASLMQIAGVNAMLPIPRILLCHRPYFLEQAAAQRVDLVLSGHTHGGQIVMGRFGNITVTPAALASRYVWGPYRSGRTQMFVSRGIGTVGLPMRINCPPEIALITLTRT